MSQTSSDIDYMIRTVHDIVVGEYEGSSAPGMLHVGSQEALDALELHFKMQGQGYEPPPGTVGQLYGVRIVIGSANTTLLLDPMDWRLLDRAGAVIAEGVIGP